MTLIVYPYRRDPATGAMEDVDESPTPPHNTMAGFEAWRQTVWGSDAVEQLGATILPSLADTNVLAEGEELDALDRELVQILDHAREIAERTDVAEDSLRFRVENMREAVRIARGVPGGGVYVG